MVCACSATLKETIEMVCECSATVETIEMFWFLLGMVVGGCWPAMETGGSHGDSKVLFGTPARHFQSSAPPSPSLLSAPAGL